MSITFRTSLGDLKFELECALTPRTCKNFLALAASGFYTGNQFHRVVKGFIAQAGRGGVTYDGQTLVDEPVSSLRHSGRGVLCMATRGPNTGASQFYVTLGPAPHLDNIDTVFGRLIDGFDTLDRIEGTPVSDKYQPVTPVTITDTIIHANPIAELER